MTEYEQRAPEKTLLYQLIADNLETFIQTLSEQGKALPEHVEKAFRSYLRCGIHAYGFMRLQCKECKQETLLAFSCKKRGFCPSCTAKKMAEVAAHLVDSILPRAPYRQFVLSVPIPLRYWMATSKKLTKKIHKIFAQETETLYLEKASRHGLTPIGSGSINFIQRFGGAINLNIHFHLLQMGGVYIKRRKKLVFKKMGVPTNKDLSSLLSRVHKRVVKLLTRLGYLKDEPKIPALCEESPLYGETLAASTQQRIATGGRKGLPVRFLKSKPLEVSVSGSLCIKLDGVSLHGAVSIPYHQRNSLERLIRYMANNNSF